MRYRASALVLVWGTLAAPGFAQGGGGQTGFTCLASVAVPPTLRAEGLAELIGDIVINCQGGSTATSGQTNITAVLNGQITSRNLANGGSEALLLTGGPPFVVCNNVTAGCLPTPTAPAPNVFQGIVSGNQVTFYGVSVQPPSTSGASRVYRITNVRANANGISGSNVDATVSSSNPSAMSITNPAPLLVGRREGGVDFSISSPFVSSCNPGTPEPAGTFAFGESFPDGFKPRVDPADPGQSTPGTIYHSESGFIVRIGSQLAGLADFGTRFNAVFNNIPQGVVIVVPQFDVSKSAELVSGESAVEGSFPTPTVTLPGGDPGVKLNVVDGSATAVYEVIKAHPNAIDTFTFKPYVIVAPTAGTGTATVELSLAPNGASTDFPRFGGIAFSEQAFILAQCFQSSLSVTPNILTQGVEATIGLHLGTTQAFGTNPSVEIGSNKYPVKVEDGQNGVAEIKVPNTTTGSVVVVNGSETTPGTFLTVQFNKQLGAGGTSSNPVLAIPRSIDSSTSSNAIAVTICRTNLLFPFVTNQAGFDTGLGIANTSSDPFGTQPQNGSCTLSYYGPDSSNTPSLPNAASSFNGLSDYLTRSVQLSTSTPNRFFFDSARRNEEPVFGEIPGAFENPAGARDPVNTLTGNDYYRGPSLRISGRKLLLNFTPSYNSMDAYTGPLGVGWTHTYNTFLILNGGNVVLKAGDGQEIPFTGAGGGAFKPGIPGVLDVLHKETSGAYTLTRRNHVQFTFSSTGQLTSITDANGNSQTLTYSSGNLTTVMDSSGRSLHLTYDSSNRIVTVGESLMRTLHYAYDAFGRLISYTDATGGVTKYSYDVNNQMVQIVDARANKADTIAYDANGRVTSTTDALGAVTTFAYNTPAAGSTTVTDPLGRVRVYSYDAKGRLVSIQDPEGGIRSVTYDGNNMILSSTDPLGHLNTFTYDANSNLTQLTDALGNSSKFAYDSEFNLLSVSDPLSHKRTFAYDSHDNLTRLQDAGGGMTTLTYNSFGQVTSAQDPRNSVTTYEYDSDGDLVQRKDPLGGITQYAYDAAGRTTGVIDPVKNHSTFAYDAANRLTKITDPAGEITSRKYDANGNLISVTDPRKITAQYAYDTANRLISIIEAAGTLEQRTTSFVYDADGNITSVKDPNGNITHYAYDGLSRIVSKTDPLGNVASVTYDANGNITAATDGNGKTNKFAYDALNRLTKEMPFTGSPIAHAYDKAGNETSMTDARGVNSYKHDALNRLTSVHTPDSKMLTYTYGVDGRLISIGLPDGSKQQYAYDVLDRITAAKDGAGNTTQFSYDAAGRLLKEAFANGDSANYMYDALSRVTAATNTHGSLVLSSNQYQYDADGNRTTDTTPAGNVTYTYDHLNRLVSATQGSQVIKYGYDANGNRTSVTASSGVTKTTFDNANRMITFGALKLSYDNNGNLINDGTHMYSYDAYNRPIEITGYNTSYTYDGHGIRVSQKTPAGIYQYVNNPLNGRVLLEDGPDGNFVNFYARRLLISEASSSLELYYHFDSIGDVATVTDKTGKSVQSYVFDGYGNETSMDGLGSKNKYKALAAYTDPVTGFLYLADGDYYNPLWGRTFGGSILAGYPDAYVFEGDNPVQ